MLFIASLLFAEQKPQNTENNFLKRTIEALLTKDESILSKQQEARAKFYDFHKARSGLLPDLNITADHGSKYSKDRRKFTTPEGERLPQSSQTNASSSVRANVRQTLWKGGALFNNVRKADAETQATFYEYYTTLSDRILNIINVVLFVQEQEALVKLYTKDIARKQKMLDEAEAKFAVGQTEESDRYNAKARLADAKQNLSTAQTTLTDYLFQFKELTSIDYKSIAWVSLPKDFNVEQLFKRVEKENFEILRAQKFHEASARDVNIAAGQFSPEVAVEGSTGLDYAGRTKTKRGSEITRSEQGRNDFGADVRLVAKWNLFSGFRDAATTKQAAATHRARAKAIFATVQKARIEFTQAKEKYRDAANDAALITETVKDYQRSYDLYFIQYQEGKRSFQDLAEIADSLNRSEARLARNMRDLRTAAFTMYKTAGRLIPETWGIMDTFNPQAEYKKTKRRPF